MSRWIDAEWLKGQINITFWAEIGKIIDNAPSIDIVRCKECIYPKESGGFYRCNYSVNWRNADDFCSYGEREDE